MREIKFKIWNLEKKQWENVLRWAISPEDGSVIDAHEPGVFTVAPFSYEIVQYTGLKDKNGKQIYEKDIIQWINYTTINDGEKNITVIEYDDKDASFYIGGWYDRDFPDTSKEALILGNIYENPELLDK